MPEFLGDSARLDELAGQIKTANQNLKETMESGKTTVGKLADTWQSPAATSTIQNFSKFADKFSTLHYDNVNTFVKFLRNDVIPELAAMEAVNTPGDGYN